LTPYKHTCSFLIQWFHFSNTVLEKAVSAVAVDERHHWRSYLRVAIKQTALILWKWCICRFTSRLLAPVENIFASFSQMLWI